MKRLALLAALGLLLGTTGCALTPDPRKNLLEGTSGHAVYKLPPEALLTLARGLLVEQGYELLPTADPLYVKTTWRIAGNVDIGASWSRILVQVVPPEEPPPAEPALYRANDFEWALLSRVDPKLAVHLQNRVDSYLAEGKHPAVTEEVSAEVSKDQLEAPAESLH